VDLTLSAWLMLSAQSFAGQFFSFQFDVPASNRRYASGSAPGVPVAGDFDVSFGGGQGGYRIEGITGTYAVNDIVTNIAGSSPVGSYPDPPYSNTNILYYPHPPLLDTNGLGFAVDNLGDGRYGHADVYFDGAAYMENASLIDLGGPGVRIVPEPGTLCPVIAGCADILSCSSASSLGIEARLNHVPMEVSLA
jgi:hypothetical protein